MNSSHILVSVLSLGFLLGVARAVPSLENPAATLTTQTATRELEAAPQLGGRIRSMLPRGLDPAKAAQGFTSVDEFVLVLHVSDNLGIPFQQLKARVTGSRGQTLGAAIRDLRPSANPFEEVRRAHEQARKDQTRDPS